MKSIKKTLMLVICALALITTSVFGTLAYLTDTAEVVNTFTVGNVSITLDETVVLPDGTPVDKDQDGTDDRTDKGNEYHLIPGKEYTKDPTVTVKAGSEESYVRMLVTINLLEELDAIFAPDGADLKTIFTGYDEAWGYEAETRNEDNTITYEFRYKETVDGYKLNDAGEKEEADEVLPALFTGFTVPGALNNNDLRSIKDLEISIVGEAIQAAGFDDADKAWDAFDAQTTKATESTLAPVASTSPTMAPSAVNP